MLRGVDLSHWNSDSQFNNIVKNNTIDFIIMKATEGVSYRDPKFMPRMHNLLGTKKLVGAYHFFTTNSDPLLQADIFLQIATADIRSTDRMLLAVDLEDTGQQKFTQTGIDNALEFCRRIRDLSGIKPLYYINKDFEKRFDFSEFIKEDFGLWIADYNNLSRKPKTLKQHKLVAIRQYDNKIIDKDVAYMSKEGWLKYAKCGEQQN